MITRRSAFPVRISYNVNVRSEPTLARTEDSERLNLTTDTVSVDVGNVRFEIGALLEETDTQSERLRSNCTTYLVSSHTCTMDDAVANKESVR